MVGYEVTWQLVPGYESIYECDLSGKVVRNRKTKRLLNYERGEYLRLSKDGVRRTYHINAVIRSINQSQALV
jgi:hypothetical protein